jgi:hypothetical protein
MGSYASHCNLPIVLQSLQILHTLRSVQMTQVVEEQDRWTEHVATHVTPVTRTQLFERAREEATSASTILRHDDFDRSLYIGPEHRRCNRSAAGTKSAELQRCKTWEW